MAIKILMVDDESDLLEIAEIILKATYDCEVTCALDGGEAIAQLKKNPGFDLIISDLEMPNVNGLELYNFIKKENIDVPFIMISGKKIDGLEEFQDFNNDSDRSVFLRKPFTGDELKEVIEKLLKNLDRASELKFYKIDIQIFHRNESVVADVYLKVSDEKYIKIMKANEAYDPDKLTKYANRGCSSLYVEQNHFASFTNSLIQSIFSNMNKKKGSFNNTFDQEADILTVLHSRLKIFGIDDDIVEVIDKVNESILKNLGKIKTFDKLFKKMKNNRDYLYYHSLLVSYIGNSIAMKMDLKNEETLKSISTAAIIHDLNIKDDDFARIHDVIDFNSDEVTEELREKVRMHPIEASNLARLIGDLSPDVPKIILHHHESPDGKGHPYGLTAKKIPRLSCIFILAEHMSSYVYDKDFKGLNFVELKADLIKTFDQGNFAAPLKGLLDLFPTPKR